MENPVPTIIASASFLSLPFTFFLACFIFVHLYWNLKIPYSCPGSVNQQRKSRRQRMLHFPSQLLLELCVTPNSQCCGLDLSKTNFWKQCKDINHHLFCCCIGCKNCNFMLSEDSSNRTRNLTPNIRVLFMFRPSKQKIIAGAYIFMPPIQLPSSTICITKLKLILCRFGVLLLF